MSVVSVNPRSFILALFIRDDGERFLLGDNGYDFKDSQLHFAANTIENDEVVKQGTDGTMLAGQVRRSAVQSFDGYVGDATMLKETIEQMRRDFFAFFVRGHHFRVIYVDCNRNAWQRKGGYLVDAPEVKELWQIHPEYHVGLNFEDVNYYSYDEDADGEEILSNLVDVPVSTAASGGLVWDEDGAVSEDAEVEYISETAVATPAKNVYITDAAEAPLASFQLDGETAQNGTPTPDAPVPVKVVTGENVVKICGKNMAAFPTGTKNGITCTRLADGGYRLNGTASGGIAKFMFDLSLTSTAHTMSYTASSAKNGVILRTRTYQADGFGAIQDGMSINTTSGSVTSSKSFGQVMIDVANGTVLSNFIIYIQLELGSTATAYEPYQGQSYPISLGPIKLCGLGDDGAGGYLYKDGIYKNLTDNKWYVHKAVGKAVLDGSVAPTATNTDATNTIRPRWESFLSPAPNSPAADRLLAKSNRFQAVSNWSADVEGIYYDEGNSGQVWLRISKTIASNQTQLVSWLQSNPVDLYYPLGSTAQTDTEITNEALIEQLETLLNTARTYAGTNNITTITPNEQGTLEISYYTKYQPVVVGGGYVWEVGGSGGATTVINNSIDNVSPIWKIFGPTQNPQLENSTTGETIEYVGMIAEGQTLTIDMGEQTASLDGLNVISNLVGDFISLAPGANRLIYSVLGDAGASSIGWSEIVG